MVKTIASRREVEGGDYCWRKRGWEREREREREDDKGPWGERGFSLVVVGELERGSDGDSEAREGGLEKETWRFIEKSVAFLRRSLTLFFSSFLIIIYLYFKLKLNKNQLKII